MPIYEYQCQSCGYHYEVMQKMSDEPLVQCPSCSQPALRKLVSAAGFRLSGSGWYETDFKKSGKRNLMEKDSKEKQPAKSSDSNKSSDSKVSDSGKSKQSNPSSSSKSAASGN